MESEAKSSSAEHGSRYDATIELTTDFNPAKLPGGVSPLWFRILLISTTGTPGRVAGSSRHLTFVAMR